jgi:hypothetical protein
MRLSIELPNGIVVHDGRGNDCAFSSARAARAVARQLGLRAYKLIPADMEKK